MLPAPLVSLSSWDWGAGKGSLPTAVFTWGVGWDLPWAPPAKLLQLQPAQPARGSRVGQDPGTDDHRHAEGHPGTVTGRSSLLLGAGPSALGQTLSPQHRSCPQPQQGCGYPVRPWSPTLGLAHDLCECVTCVPRQAAGLYLTATPITRRGLDICLCTPVSPPFQCSGMKEPENAHEAGRPGQQLGWGEQTPGRGTV